VLALRTAAAALSLLALVGFGGGMGPSPQIVAVELQPEDPSPGGQFVVLVNRGQTTVDLRCWTVRASAATLWVAPPLRLPPAGVALLSGTSAWLRASDRVRLFDAKARLRAATPNLSDTASDDRIWFKDASGAWQLGRKGFGKGVIAGQLVKRAPSRC
jgi:hypothetical protein